MRKNVFAICQFASTASLVLRFLQSQTIMQSNHSNNGRNADCVTISYLLFDYSPGSFNWIKFRMIRRKPNDMMVEMSNNCLHFYRLWKEMIEPIKQFRLI